MLIFRDIAMVFAVAVMMGLLFRRLGQPLILGYVFAGLVLSPLTPGVRVHDVHVFEIMAEVGVVLLMFTIGTEFSVPALLGVKWIALIGAPVGVSLSIVLGAVVSVPLGWPIAEGIAVGCIISTASTMVLIRLLMDRGELTSDTGRLMVAITLVEDLAVVMLTVLLPNLSSATGLGVGKVLWGVAKSLLLLAPVVLIGCKVVPRILARIAKAENEEISVLVALTIGLAVAAITESFGLSLALGAFVGGLLLGNSAYAHEFASKTFPIRDAFVALFFVTVGMLIDPAPLLSGWRVLLVMVGLIVAGKFAIWFTITRLFGYPAQTALRVSIGLTQIGEFSFVLGRIALQSALITEEVYNATLAASLLSILINAALFRLLKATPSPAGLGEVPAEQAAVATNCGLQG